MTSSPPRRVVVTGMGTVTAWGVGINSFWHGLCSGECAIQSFDRFDHRNHRTHIAGQSPDPSIEGKRRRTSLSDRFALSAAMQAIEQAGLPANLADLDAGVFVGSSTGGLLESESYYEGLAGRAVDRRAIPAMMSQHVSGPGDAVARGLRVSGPVETVSSACATGALAIGMGLAAVRDGTAELVLAGGADSLCRTTYGGFNSLQAVDPRPCRPFRADRAGLSLGEGAGVVVLEPRDAALSRGVTPAAELLGCGMSADAHHMTAPDPDGVGAALALQRALEDGRSAPDCVDFVNTHGTATPLNDASEFRALERVFGTRARTIPVTSTKGSVGHLLGSAGAVEAVATVLCLIHQRVHPTPGPGEIDPETPVRLVRGRGLTGTALDVGVSLNLGFGGSNGALVFKRWSEA